MISQIFFMFISFFYRNSRFTSNHKFHCTTQLDRITNVKTSKHRKNSKTTDIKHRIQDQKYSYNQRQVKRLDVVL